MLSKFPAGVLGAMVFFRTYSRRKPDGTRFDTTSSRLQLYKPDGTKFHTYIEVNLLLDQERDRANQERDRANQAEALLQKYRDRYGELA